MRTQVSYHVVFAAKSLPTTRKRTWKWFLNRTNTATLTSFVWVRRCRIYLACFRNVVPQYSQRYGIVSSLFDCPESTSAESELSLSSILLYPKDRHGFKSLGSHEPRLERRILSFITRIIMAHCILRLLHHHGVLINQTVTSR